jgi:hypothetical protein
MTDRRPRLLAVVRHYNDLPRGLSARCAELGMTRIELDRRAGLADGHAGKLLAPWPSKRFGMTTLHLSLAATRTALILVEDDAALAEIEQLLAVQASSQAPARPPHWREHNSKRRAWASRMAALRAIKLSPARRSEIASKAARARWEKRKLE